MIGLPQDNLIDIFLYNPCDDVFAEITDKELALELLREQKDSVQKLEFLHSKGDKIRKMDILKLVIEENNFDRFKTIVDGVRYGKNTVTLILHCAKHGREDMMRYLMFNFPVGASEWRDDDHIADISKEAAESGLTEMVNYLIDEEGCTDYYGIAMSAIEGGHMDIVDSLEEELDDNYQAFAEVAAEGGQLEIVLYMIEKGADDYGEIALSAAQFQHFDIVREMIKRGLDDDYYNRIAYFAARYGKTEILSNRKVSYNWIAKGYAIGGYRDSLSSIITRTTQSSEFYNKLAVSAAMGDHTEIVYDLINGIVDRNGTLVSANNYSDIAYQAAENGNSVLVFDMISRVNVGDISLSRIAYSAVGKSITIVDAMINMGVNDSYIVNYSAVVNGRVDILRNNNVQYKKSLVSLAVENGQMEVVDHFYNLKKEYRLSGFDSVFY